MNDLTRSFRTDSEMRHRIYYRRFHQGTAVRCRKIIWPDGDCPQVGQEGTVAGVYRLPQDDRPRVEVLFDDSVLRTMDPRELDILP